MKICDVKMMKDGIVCKTTSENLIYRKGEYCYKSNVIYPLLSDTTHANENVNSITGTNEEPLYIESSAFGKNIKWGVDATDRFIELTSDAIRVADAGHYIVGEGNVLADNNDNYKEISIYECTNKECKDIGNLDENEYIISQ